MVGQLSETRLVAAVAKGCSAREVAMNPCGGSRTAHFAFGLGRLVVHVFNVYIPPQGGLVGNARRDCVAVTRQVLAEAAELGQVPVFVVGDFNHDPLPAAVEAALALGGWRDLADGLGPTTNPGLGRNGRRIDRVYANAGRY